VIWLIGTGAAFVAATVFAGWMLRRSYDSQPKRPPTLTEEYLRDRALNAKRRPRVHA
jgi:hypothetical protein